MSKTLTSGQKDLDYAAQMMTGKKYLSLEKDMTNENPCPQSKHSTVIWDDYFMFLALLSSKRSKDPITQVGACVVDNVNRIVAIGYNGLPRNCHDNEFPWGKSEDQINDKKMYVVHAEANAILNKNLVSICGMRLYTTLFPCNDCAKLIIQSGISTVYYLTDKYQDKPKYKASRRMFAAAGVECKRIVPQSKYLNLNFEEITSADLSSSLKNLQLDFAPSSKTVDFLRTTAEQPQSKQQKRLNYIYWDDYFMAIALLAAKRSKDVNDPVGACIVDSWQRVVAIGYNGLPRNCKDSDFVWDNLIWKMCVVHAEANAILNMNLIDGNGTRLFTTIFPCYECIKLIIQTGIAEISFLVDNFGDQAKKKCREMYARCSGYSLQAIYSIAK